MCSLLETYQAGIPVILADDLFTSRVNRLRRVIASDMMETFNRSGILQTNIFFEPRTLEEYLCSCYQLMVCTMYCDFWSTIGIRTNGLTKSKLSIIAASVSMPEYVFSMIYPLLQPIVVGNSVYIPSPSAFWCESFTAEDSLTVFGGRLGPYNELAERFGMYFRVNLLNAFKTQFVGAKITLSNLAPETYLTVWPVRFKRIKRKYTDDKKLVPLTPVTKLDKYSPRRPSEEYPENDRFTTMTPSEFVEAYEEIISALPDVSYDTTDVWWIPNCHMKLGRDSVAFQLALISYIEISTPCDMNAPRKRDIGLHLSEYSNLSRYENNVYCIHDSYYLPEIFQSIYDMRCKYGRVDNPFGVFFSRVPTNIQTYMASNWKDSIFPSLGQATVFEFPSPFAPDLQLYNGIFRVSVHKNMKQSAPPKAAKAETTTNTHMGTSAPADPAAAELSDIKTKVNRNTKKKNKSTPASNSTAKPDDQSDAKAVT